MLLTDRVILITGIASSRSLATGALEAVVRAGGIPVCAVVDERMRERVRPVVEAVAPEADILLMDVRDDATVRAAMDAISRRHQRLDGFLHAIAAGALVDDASQPLPVSRADAAAWERTLQVSARSLPQLVSAAESLLGAGSAVVALTYDGARVAKPGYNLMGVAKAALEASVRYLALEYGPRDIRVNAVSAGPVRTPASSGVPGFRDRLQRAAQVAPLQRNVTAAEVGEAAAWLLAPAASGVTGQILHVDAGASSVG